MTRLILAGLLMAGLGAVVIYGSWKMLHPFLLQHDQTQEIARLEERAAQLKREHGRLKDTVRRLSTRKGQAEELRRMGYVRPKERIIRFLKGTPPAEPDAGNDQEAASSGVKDRIKEWLEGRLERGRAERRG